MDLVFKFTLVLIFAIFAFIVYLMGVVIKEYLNYWKEDK